MALFSVLLNPGAFPRVAGQPKRARRAADCLRKGRRPLSNVQHRAGQ